MNSFTGIFQQSFKPLAYVLTQATTPPLPPSNLKEPLSMGGHSPHVRNTIVKLTVLTIKINFSLLQILTVNSLNIKHQRKSFNQLAFNLSAYMYL